MAILKFRAWDAHEKKMFTNAQIIVWNGNVYANDNSELSVNNLKGWSIDEKYLMQSTGIKDRNGVEIFEGDMFKDGVVEYDVELGMWIVSFFKFDNYMKLSNYLRDFKGSVIGNIYENPDLVEEQ